jgi:hypothetical protein
MPRITRIRADQITVVGDYFVDIIVNDLIILEIKAAEGLRDENRDFLLSSGLKNHREHREHREKLHRSVLSVYSVVEKLCSISLF